jgi:serpin B
MNTIYFKAKWQKTFQEGATYPREFTNENGEAIKPDFLNKYRSSYNYFETEEADGVILPYDDGNLCMIAIRPQNGQTARQLAQSLTAETVTSYLAGAKSTYMNLHLPKFTMAYSLQMNDILKELGLTDVFAEEKADLGGLGTGKKAADGNLFISDVLQKVKVAVDEEGTEAAAATAVMTETTSAMIDEEEPLEVDFNEPFVYAIVAAKTPFGEKNQEHVPLFLGVVTDLSGELSDGSGK